MRLPHHAAPLVHCKMRFAAEEGPLTLDREAGVAIARSDLRILERRPLDPAEMIVPRPACRAWSSDLIQGSPGASLSAEFRQERSRTRKGTRPMNEYESLSHSGLH